MTKFAIVYPQTHRVEWVQHEDILDAYAQAGLKAHQVDHGVAARYPNPEEGGIGIVVYEFGLFTPAAEQHYFAVDKRLYGGNAVLYGFDAFGETIDLDFVPHIKWFADIGEIEREIKAQHIIRPSMKLNGEVLWTWPNAKPGFMK